MLVLTVVRNGCSTERTKGIKVRTRTIDQIISVTSTDPTCDGNDGTITIESEDLENGCLEFSLDDVNYQSEKVFTGLPTGSYQIYVRYCNEDCPDTYGDIIELNDPEVPTVTIVGEEVPECVGTNTASATAQANGGKAPYEYLWSSGETTATANALSAGLNSVTVTDANNCITEATVIIEQAIGMTLEPTIDDVSCYGFADGRIEITVSGGTAPYSYNWSNGETSQNVENVLAGEHTVEITDANDCVFIQTFTVSEPTELEVLASRFDASCKDADDGSINVTVSGGTTPYTFNWSTGETTEDIDNLAPGLYTVEVADANNCTVNISIEILEPEIIVVTANATDASCANGSDGTIDLDVTGGTPPYSYLWSDGSTGSSLEDLSTGTYNVIVTDANGCTGEATAIIEAPEALQLTTTKRDVGCSRGSDGSINLEVSGGTTPYFYTWSNGSVSQDIDDLEIGTYSVTVTDGNGCRAFTSVTIENAPRLELNITTTNITCNGADDGTAELSLEGGTAPYRIIWSTGAETNNISGLAAGNYTVIVIDNNGCRERASATITEPEALICQSIVPTNATGAGLANGNIDLTPEGGTTPYSYEWSNGATSQDLENVAAGTYTVIITDANNCTTSCSATINEPSPLSCLIDAADVSCDNGNDGTLTVTAEGGSGQFEYSLNNIDFTTSNIFNNLPAGNYTVYVRDLNEQSITSSCFADIFEPEGMSLSFATTDASCFDSEDGSVELTVTGGTGPYSFNWDNGDSSEDINFVGEGTYSVIVTDANGCSIEGDVVVFAPDEIFIDIVQLVDVSCFGGDDGGFDVFAFDGTPPYEFSAVHLQTNENFDNFGSLPAGDYIVYALDDNGCVQEEFVTIDQPDPLSVNVTTDDVSCKDGSDGSINLNIFGGTTPYDIDWSTGSNGTSINNLAVGTYAATITDENGCQEFIEVSITEPSLLELSTVATNASCNNGSDGSINLIVVGGTTPYSYSWSNGSTTQDLNNIPAGIYTVTVTDVNGCEAIISDLIEQPVSMGVSVNIDNVSCFGESDGVIDLTISGGVTPYTFAWSNGATTEDIGNLAAGTYTVTITDSNNCEVIEQVEVTQRSLLTVTGNGVDVSCFDGNDASISLNVTGGRPPYNYSWSNGSTTENLSNLGIGTYTVTVTDQNDCEATTSVVIEQPAPLSLEATPLAVLCYDGNDGSISLTVSGGTAPYSYEWSNGATTRNLSNLIAGDYEVVVTDNNGCTATITTTVIQPNAFVCESIIPTAATGKGLSNGSIDLSVAGGTAPYSYQWSNGATTQDINGLAAGTYGVTITDANNCITSCTATVDEPTGVTCGEIETEAVLCTGDDNGIIRASGIGGSGSYEYSLDGSNYQSSNEFTGLEAGIYTVYVRDVNETQSASTCQAVVNEPATLRPNLSPIDVNCKDGNDGSINLQMSGGIQPYTFAWSNGATTEDIFDLTAGQYAVTITDANGCTISAFTSVVEPDALTLTINETDVKCNGGADGRVDLTVTGGTAPFTYQWSNGTTSQDLNGVVAGIYFVTVVDAQGCTTDGAALVGESKDLLSMNLNPQSESCLGAGDGGVAVEVFGGAPPYTYLWSNGTTTKDLTNISAGTYTLEVTDNRGCVRSTTVEVQTPIEVTLELAKVDVSCNGGVDGSIDLSASGGAAPYTYEWSNGATSQDLSNIRAGRYTVVVTDANGCSTNGLIDVEEPDLLTLITNKTNLSCNGGAAGAINLIVSGGVAPFTYIWSNGMVTEDLNNLVSGTYSVTVTDANNCTGSTEVTIAEPAPLTIEFLGAECDNSGSPGDPNDDVYTFNVVVRKGNSTGTWTSNNGIRGQFGRPITIGALPIASGEFTFMVSDDSNSSCTESIVITPPSTCSAQCGIEATIINEECDNGGTLIDPTDDTFMITVLISGDNTDSQWKTRDVNGVEIRGNYDETYTFGPFPTGRDAFTIPFQDVTSGKCLYFLSVEPRNHCSDLCNIRAVQTGFECNDNGTPNILGDDTFTATLVVTGGPTNAWTSDNGLSGAYDQEITIGPLPVNSGDIRIEFSDQTHPTCAAIFELDPRAACALQNCAIEAQTTNISCNDNGTPDIADDDTFTFDLYVTGDNTSDQWSAIINGIQFTGSYNETMNVGPFPISSGAPLTFDVNDSDLFTCKSTVTVYPPASCTSSCGIVLSVENIFFDENGTPSDRSDDNYSLELLALSSQNPQGNWFATINGNAITGQFGNGKIIGPFSAAAGVVEFDVADVQGGDCTESFTFTPYVEPCELLALTGNVVCNNNGTPNNINDDTYTFDVMVINEDNQTGNWVATDLGRQQGTFGQVVTFGPYPIDKHVEFRIFDQSNMDCQTVVFMSPPTECNPDCSINVEVQDIACIHDNTISVDDDTYSFKLLVTGEHTGFEWETLIDGRVFTGYYGVVTEVGPFEINDGDLSFEVFDKSKASCIENVTVTAPIASEPTEDLVVGCANTNHYCSILGQDIMLYPTDPYECTATMLVPLPNVITTCDQGWIVTTEVFDENGALITTIGSNASRLLGNLSVGDYTIRYSVTDNCGKQAAGDCIIRVADTHKPIINCASEMTIGIAGIGSTRVYAERFDMGSFDNCAIERLEVRRTYLNDEGNCEDVDRPYYSEWAGFIDLGCCDVGQIVTVEIRAIDVNGNESICWTDISVEDNSAPVFTASNSINVECSSLSAGINLSLPADLQVEFGMPEVADNCSVIITELAPEVNMTDACNGTVTRRFTAIDEFGNTSEPFEQVITISGTGQFTETEQDRSIQANSTAKVSDELTKDAAPKLYQNSPNPFVYETTIRFDLPEAGEAKLIVHDFSGNILKMIEGNFTKGVNEVKLEKGNLPNGVLFYTLEAQGQLQTKRMITLE